MDGSRPSGLVFRVEPGTLIKERRDPATPYRRPRGEHWWARTTDPYHVKVVLYR